MPTFPYIEVNPYHKQVQRQKKNFPKSLENVIDDKDTV